MNGVQLIAKERERQKPVEGWSSQHDDGHEDGELALAAACYALPSNWRANVTRNVRHLTMTLDLRALLWPWQNGWWRPTPRDRVRELAKAGALIAAEIDRLQRAERRKTRAARPQV